MYISVDFKELPSKNNEERIYEASCDRLSGRVVVPNDTDKKIEFTTTVGTPNHALARRMARSIFKNFGSRDIVVHSGVQTFELKTEYLKKKLLSEIVKHIKVNVAVSQWKQIDKNKNIGSYSKFKENGEVHAVVHFSRRIGEQNVLRKLSTFLTRYPVVYLQISNIVNIVDNSMTEEEVKQIIKSTFGGEKIENKIPIRTKTTKLPFTRFLLNKKYMCRYKKFPVDNDKVGVRLKFKKTITEQDVLKCLLYFKQIYSKVVFKINRPGAVETELDYYADESKLQKTIHDVLYVTNISPDVIKKRGRPSYKQNKQPGIKKELDSGSIKLDGKYVGRLDTKKIGTHIIFIENITEQEILYCVSKLLMEEDKDFIDEDAVIYFRIDGCSTETRISDSMHTSELEEIIHQAVLSQQKQKIKTSQQNDESGGDIVIYEKATKKLKSKTTNVATEKQTETKEPVRKAPTMVISRNPGQLLEKAKINAQKMANTLCKPVRLLDNGVFVGDYYPDAKSQSARRKYLSTLYSKAIGD